MSVRLAAYCKRRQMLGLASFDSVLLDDFGPGSHVDLLVRFDPNARHTRFDQAKVQVALTTLVGRKADIIERVAVERSPSNIRRMAILRSAETNNAA